MIELPDTIRELAELARVDPVPQSETKFNFRGIEALFSRPKVGWIVDRFARPGDVVMMFGQSNSGKTVAVVDLVVRGALGKPVFGEFACSRPFTSLYLFEEGSAGIESRLRASCNFHGIDEGDEPFRRIYWDDKVPKFFGADPEKSADKVIEQIRGFEEDRGLKLDFVVIDTMSDAAEGADENDNAHARKIMGEAQRVAKEANCIVLLIHHSPKDSAGHPRGASAFRAKADVVVEVSGERNPRFIKCDKFRDGRKWEPITFRIVAHLESAVPEFGVPDSSASWQAEVWEVLRQHCCGEAYAKSVPQIRQLVATRHDERELRDFLARESREAGSKIRAIDAHSKTADGHRAKKCRHYFWQGDADENVAAP